MTISKESVLNWMVENKVIPHDIEEGLIVPPDGWFFHDESHVLRTVCGQTISMDEALLFAQDHYHSDDEPNDTEGIPDESAVVDYQLEADRRSLWVSVYMDTIANTGNRPQDKADEAIRLFDERFS